MKKNFLKENKLAKKLVASGAALTGFANNLAYKVMAANELTSVSVVNTSTLINNILNMVVQFTIIGGAFWAVWGVIVLAGGLKDKNGPALQSGIWQIVGGALIIVASAMFKTTFGFVEPSTPAAS